MPLIGNKKMMECLTKAHS